MDVLMSLSIVLVLKGAITIVAPIRPFICLGGHLPCR